MHTIHKSILTESGVVDPPIPYEADILTAQLQKGKVTLWYTVDPDVTVVTRHRKVKIAGPGGYLANLDLYTYINSVQDGPYVWHVFAEAR